MEELVKSGRFICLNKNHLSNVRKTVRTLGDIDMLFAFQLEQPAEIRTYLPVAKKRSNHFC